MSDPLDRQPDAGTRRSGAVHSPGCLDTGICLGAGGKRPRPMAYRRSEFEIELRDPAAIDKEE